MSDLNKSDLFADLTEADSHELNGGRTCIRRLVCAWRRVGWFLRYVCLWQTICY
jgi:hypothetical protein